MSAADATTTTPPPGYGARVLHACPTCGAAKGAPCVTARGGRVQAAGGVHPSRMALEAAELKDHSAMVFIK